jgi:TolB-like protein/tetratricopeptide (TPR) repeat protein
MVHVWCISQFLDYCQVARGSIDYPLTIVGAYRPSSFMPESGFIAELRKRKVFQVAAIYVAVSWGVTEIAVTVVEQLFLPRWVSTLAVIGFIAGFPVAMFLAWAFDISSEGIRRTTVSSRRGKASIVASLVLLIASTAGLFFLIKPSIQDRPSLTRTTVVLPNSIAVLPFENASHDPADAYLSAGLSDELRDQLGRVSGMRIAARSSSIAVLGLEADAKAMSAKLGVAVLVEGSLRRRGNTLRVSVQLIDGATGLAVWNETFDRGPQELLGVQQAIARQIVLHVLPEAQQVVATPATRNASANELMLLARYHEQKVRASPEVNVDTLLNAIRLYREATAADPESALAHSRLASALLYLGDLEAVEAPIFRALSLDPNLSEVQDTLGLYYWTRGLPGAGIAFRRALELNPNNADALNNYAYWTWFDSANQDPAEFYRRALELDPLSLSRYGALGEFLGKQGRADETLEIIRRVEELFDDIDSYVLIGWLQELAGNADQSIAWTIRARDLEPGNPLHSGRLAYLYAEIGDFDTALLLEPEPGVGLLFKMRRYEELIDTAEFLMIEEPEDKLIRYLLAFAYNATGQFESAVWVLSSTGLPDSVIDGARLGDDLEGYMTLVNAVSGAGESQVADGLAAHWMSKGTRKLELSDWWANSYTACALAVLGRDADALQRLQRGMQSTRLASVPILMDSYCFQKYKGESAYQEVLQHFDERRTGLRKRLPATLADFGVTL